MLMKNVDATELIKLIFWSLAGIFFFLMSWNKAD